MEPGEQDVGAVIITAVYHNPVEEYARSYAQARAEAYCRYLPGGETDRGRKLDEPERCE